VDDHEAQVEDDPGREHERLNRNFNELLQELRVAQTGVQILFAFLLTLPFTQRFAKVSSFERNVYLVTLLLATFASIFLIAPVIQHRLNFRRDLKTHIVWDAHHMAILGLACLAGAITTAVFLVVHYLFGTTALIVVMALVVGLFLATWIGLPLARRAR
jgi:predicted neutral ceramidase superfamily lipid hydrolase